MSRKGKVFRKTKETSISVEINIDGKGKYKIDTGIGFLDHMLEQLSKHSLIDINLKAKGDTHIDLHHTTEDTGIAIGEALKKALKNFAGIRRYAHAMIPWLPNVTWYKPIDSITDPGAPSPALPGYQTLRVCIQHALCP